MSAARIRVWKDAKDCQAFEAPLLDSNTSNSSSRELVRGVEERPIRYGARDDLFVDGRTKLSFAHPQFITQPASGSHFA